MSDDGQFVIPGLDGLGTKHSTQLEQAVARTLDELHRTEQLVELQAASAQTAITAARLAERMLASGKLSMAHNALRLVFDIVEQLTAGEDGEAAEQFNADVAAMLEEMKAGGPT